MVEAGSGVEVIEGGAEAGPSNASIGGLGGEREDDAVCVGSAIEAALAVSEVTEACRCLFLEGRLGLGS